MNQTLPEPRVGLIHFDTVKRNLLIKPEWIPIKVLLMCGWVKVVPRDARWLSAKHWTLAVTKPVPQNIELLTHALTGIRLVVVE